MNHQLPSSLILSPSRFSQSRSYFQFTLLIPYTAPPIGDYQYFNVNKPTAGFHSLYFVPYFPPHCIWVFQERLMYRGTIGLPNTGADNRLNLYLNTGCSRIEVSLFRHLVLHQHIHTTAYTLANPLIVETQRWNNCTKVKWSFE